MEFFRSAARRAITLACICIFNIGAVAAEPAMRRTLQINYASPTNVAVLAQDQGLIADLIVNAELLRTQRALIAKHEFIKRRLPDFDMVGAIVEATRCFPMGGEAHRCLEPNVLQGAGEPLPDRQHAPGDVEQIISVTTDYNKSLAFIGGLWITLTFDEATYGAKGEAVHRYFSLSYWQPPESKLGKGSPFDEATESRLSAEEKRVQDYWMGNSPSRFETNVRRALEDFTTLADRYYPFAGDRTQDAAKTDWARSLPTRGSLRDQGINACRWNECKQGYVEARSGRIIIIPAQLPRGSAFQSAPISIYKQP